ncbi:hypothetical protein MMC07_008054 [Pseudocyphellaria aurata]|nr:hypothetical protein [Pseudocyphellaria aurata]
MAVNVGYGDEQTPNRGYQLYFAALIMVILAGLFVFGRLAARWTNRKFGMDDYTIVLSLACSIVLSITINLAVVHGYGKHKKDLTHTELLAALKWFYFAQIFYKLVLGFNKISLLSLYLRIFLGKFFKGLCYASLAIVIGWTVGSVFATIFQCVPISAFWDKSVVARCTDSDAFWYAYGILNILTDAIILGLPIHEVMKLQLPRREKLGLLLVFLLGAFVCVTSIVRVIAVANSTKNKADTTWSFISRSTWTLLEANTGIICACLPTLKKPITMLFPRMFRGSSKGSSSTPRPSRKSHHLGSSPTTSTWVSSDGTIMTSVTAGQSRKGHHAWESEEDMELESQMRHPRRIMRQTDVVVSHYSGNDSPDRSLQDSTPAKEAR